MSVHAKGGGGGGHTLSIFPNVGITLLACCVALLNLSVTEILLIKFSNK
jgi:hypothetical protein